MSRFASDALGFGIVLASAFGFWVLLWVVFAG